MSDVLNVELGASAERMRATLERFRAALERAEITLEGDADMGPSPLRRVWESMGGAAGVAIGTLSGRPFAAAAVDHERVEMERRNAFLRRPAPEPLEHGPNGGIVLPLFGGVELPRIVRRVEVRRNFWDMEVTLYGETSGCRFRTDEERVFMWERGRFEPQRMELRRRFLDTVARAVHELERRENQQAPEHAGRPRVFLSDARSGREIELTDQVTSLGYRVSGTDYGWDRVEQMEMEGMKRSRELLLSNLSPDQEREFRGTGRFSVTASSGKQYAVEKSQAFNVKDLETGTRYCAQPAGGLPVYDCMLAQKLWLETDEETFLAVANVKGEFLE